MKRLSTFVFLLVAIISPIGSARDLPDFPFVSAKGSAERSVKPDRATLHIQIAAYDKSSETAMSKANSTMQKVVSILLKHKVKKSQIEASDWSKSVKRKRSERYELLQILGYEMSRSLTVQLNLLESYPRLVSELASVDYVSDVRGWFDVSNREQLEADLLEEAARNARANAEKSAKALGSEIQSVYAINTYISSQVDDGIYLGQPSFKLREADGGRMKVFIPKTIEVTNRLSVVFRLKE